MTSYHLEKKIYLDSLSKNVRSDFIFQNVFNHFLPGSFNVSPSISPIETDIVDCIKRLLTFLKHRRKILVSVLENVEPFLTNVTTEQTVTSFFENASKFKFPPIFVNSFQRSTWVEPLTVIDLYGELVTKIFNESTQHSIENDLYEPFSRYLLNTLPYKIVNDACGWEKIIVEEKNILLPLASFRRKISLYNTVQINGGTCEICQENIESDAAKLFCGHCFHRECANRHLLRTNKCPTCKKKQVTRIEKIKMNCGCNHCITMLKTCYYSDLPRDGNLKYNVRV